MPSRVANGTAGARFELPALDLNFGSITDGTNIPPPPASPVQKVPTPPQTPPPNSEVKPQVVAAVANGAAEKTLSPNGNLAGTKRPAEDPPVSPALSSGRPGSLRRLFSRTMLNNAYAEGQVSNNGSVAVASAIRPVSQSGGSLVDERKAKRSSGWFRRLRTGDAVSKRSSLMFEESPTATTPKKLGPPPPMIPELADLEKDEGSLGNDLFKNIR